MRQYLVRRIIQNVFTFFAFLTLTYFLMEAQPGDFADLYLSDPRLTPDQREILAASLGLDKSPGERYLIWLGNFFQGDLGISFSNYPRPVTDVLAERAPRTLTLFITANVVAWYVGFVTGKLLAWRRGGILEYGLTLGGVILYTVFTPWFGLMMIWFFSFQLGWFPTGKFVDPIFWRNSPYQANFVFNRLILWGIAAGIIMLVWVIFMRRQDPITRRRFSWIGPVALGAAFLGFWLFLIPGETVEVFGADRNLGGLPYAVHIMYHLFLPVFTLTLIAFAGTMLLTRNSMLETLREDYILTARAKGLPEKVIRDKHAARNALLPVITSLVFALAFALDGGVITETIFSWPGMGATLVEAATVEDIPMVVGALVFVGILALTAHLFVDILYAYLDPRIRYS